MKQLDQAMVPAGQFVKAGWAGTDLARALPSGVQAAEFAAGGILQDADNDNAQPCAGGYAGWGKRCLDLTLIALALPVVLPIVLLFALLLWAEGGQPFYSQIRLGRSGRRFRILKLRTMVRDADARLARVLEADPVLRREWDETQKLKTDPRVTPVGRILRASSLDELPQLWNVVTGDMSLVGPRPMLPEQLPLYGAGRAYFELRPGLTGIWQVSARNESRFSDRVQADEEYLAKRSLAYDGKLILKTFSVVARRTGY